MLDIIKNKFDKLPSFKETKCDDEFVAIIEISNCGCKFLANYIKNEKLRKAKHKEISELPYRTILIILESPNVKEFYKINTEEMASPALGKTGSIISQYLLYHLHSYMLGAKFDEEMLTRNIKDEYIGKYKLLIVNAIQYKTKYKKQKLFVELFEKKEFCEDFKKRLKNYNPTIVINSCTKEGKIKVHEVIKEIYKCKILSASHPSGGDYWSPFIEC